MADRFESMAQQRDAMSQRVIDALERLTAALGGAEGGLGGGGGGASAGRSGGGGGGGGGSSGGGAGGGKSSSGGGLGEIAGSVGKAALGSMGEAGSALSSVLGAGSAGGAFTAGAEAFLKYSAQMGQAKQDGLLSAPLYSGAGREQFESQFREQSAALSTERSVDAVFNAFGFQGPAAMLRGALGFQDADPTMAQRRLDEDRGRRTAVADTSAQRVEGIFANRIAAGGQVSDDQLQHVTRLVQGQQRRSQKFHERVTKMSNEMAGFEPNAKLEGM